MSSSWSPPIERLEQLLPPGPPARDGYLEWERHLKELVHNHAWHLEEADRRAALLLTTERRHEEFALLRASFEKLRRHLAAEP